LLFNTTAALSNMQSYNCSPTIFTVDKHFVRFLKL